MKTLLPYFYNNEFLQPLKGHFILPLKEIIKIGDQFCYDRLEWKIANRIGEEIKGNGDCWTYARPIKGNEELYNQMAFLPEKIITPPEGYYLLPANEELKGGDIGYWKADDKWLLKTTFGSNGSTPLNNYIEFKNSDASVIAFARKIEIMKKEYSKHGFNVKIDSQKQFDKISKLANKYGFYNPGLTFDYCTQTSKQDHFYLVFDRDFSWNLTPFEANKNDVYEKWTYEDIEDHFKAICKKSPKIDYSKYINFQVKVKNNGEFREVEDLAIKYGYNPIGLNYDSIYNIIQFTKESIYQNPKSLTWSHKEYRPEEYYYYPDFDKETIENHLKAVTGINNKVKVDYSKYPKFQIFISNEEEYKEAQSIAVKYGYVVSPHSFHKSFYFIIGYDSNKVAWNPYEYKPEEYYTHRKFDSKLIEEHFKAIFDYSKFPNFQVKICNQKQFNIVNNEIAEKYSYYKLSSCYENDYPIYIQFWKNKALSASISGAYKPETFYVYENFDRELIEKHIKAIINKTETMSTQTKNKITKVDYAKYPNFAVKVDNDNTRVMLIALGEKFGMKKFAGDFHNELKEEYIYLSKKDSVSLCNWRKNEIRQGFRNCFENEDTHIYETPDWPAIIKHFEAKVVEEKPLPVLHGYTMGKYVKGNPIVKFGCAEISIEMLSGINDLIINQKFSGNRNVATIGLEYNGSPTKTLSKVQIKEILDYVDWVSKQ